MNDPWTTEEGHTTQGFLQVGRREHKNLLLLKCSAEFSVPKFIRYSPLNFHQAHPFVNAFLFYNIWKANQGGSTNADCLITGQRDREGEFLFACPQDRSKIVYGLYILITGTPVPGPILALPRGIRPATASHHVAARPRAAGLLCDRAF